MFFDANSGFGSGGTITLNTAPWIKSITQTSGHTYSFATYSNFYVEDSATFESGCSSPDKLNLYLTGVSQDSTLTQGGTSILDINIVDTGKWTLQGDLVITGEFYHDNGTFDANDHNITAATFYFYADTGNAPTVYMGSGTWNQTEGAGTIYFEQYSGEYITVYPETSTIKIFGENGGISSLYVYDDEDVEQGKTFNNIWFYGEAGSGFYIRNSQTFNDFKCDVEGAEIEFRRGYTTTVSTFTVSGASGNLITLKSSSSGTQFTLSKSSGTVECDYLDIIDSNAIGGAHWYAGDNSTDSGNNSGWVFTDRKYPLPPFRS